MTEHAATCSRCKSIVPTSAMLWETLRPKFLEPKRFKPEKLCWKCIVETGGDQLDDYRALAASKNKEPYKSFLIGMNDVQALVDIPLPDKKLSQSLARIPFATVITAMETYLADTFINRVSNNNELLKRCVQTIAELRERKLQLGDIFDKYYKLPDQVRHYLVNILFHNIPKVGDMYRSVLQVNFPNNMIDIIGAVERRHDIVHRSGKSKSGSESIVSASDVHGLVKSMKRFVQSIENQLP